MRELGTLRRAGRARRVQDDRRVGAGPRDVLRIGRGVRIRNEKKVQEEEGKNYVIREGVVVIPKGAVVLDGTVI